TVSRTGADRYRLRAGWGHAGAFSGFGGTGEALGETARLPLREGDGDDQHDQRGPGDGEPGAVVVPQADDGRQDQQAHQVHHLDQRVEGGTGRVLEGVANGVTDD